MMASEVAKQLALGTTKGSFRAKSQSVVLAATNISRVKSQITYFPLSKERKGRFAGNPTLLCLSTNKKSL